MPKNHLKATPAAQDVLDHALMACQMLVSSMKRTELEGKLDQMGLDLAHAHAKAALEKREQVLKK